MFLFFCSNKTKKNRAMSTSAPTATSVMSGKKRKLAPSNPDRGICGLGCKSHDPLDLERYTTNGVDNAPWVDAFFSDDKAMLKRCISGFRPGSHALNPARYVRIHQTTTREPLLWVAIRMGLGNVLATWNECASTDLHWLRAKVEAFEELKIFALETKVNVFKVALESAVLSASLHKKFSSSLLVVRMLLMEMVAGVDATWMKFYGSTTRPVPAVLDNVDLSYHTRVETCDGGSVIESVVSALRSVELAFHLNTWDTTPSDGHRTVGQRMTELIKLLDAFGLLVAVPSRLINTFGQRLIDVAFPYMNMQLAQSIESDDEDEDEDESDDENGNDNYIGTSGSGDKDMSDSNSEYKFRL